MLRYLLFYFIFYYCAIFYSSSKEHHEGKELKDKNLSPIVQYSEHDNPSEPFRNLNSFNSNYRSKPFFINNVSLDFTPNRLYAQVRHRDIVKRLPRGHISDEVKTDEEQENINRLRAVVKKQKINTYYTEEGYEDAAYDHAGHIRDADFDENFNIDVSKKIVPRKNENNKNYKNVVDDDDDDNFNGSVEFKKFDDVYPHYDFFHTWEESGNSPQKFTESEIWKLEKDLIEKKRELADNAETEIPKNSRFSTDNFEDNTSDSDEYNIVSSSLNDDDSKENDISDSREFEKKSESKFRIVAAPIDLSLNFFEANITSTESNIQNATLKSKPLLDSIDEITSDLTTPKSHDPSLSQIYETWKRKGIEEKYEELSEIRDGEHNLISREYSSEEKSDKASTELETSKRLNKKYILLVRKPTLSCNDSKSKDLYSKNKEYFWNDKDLTVLRPPPSLPPSQQLMYADFLLQNHDNSIESSVTQKSGSIDTSIEENNIPPSIFVYHYYRQPHYRHQPTWKDLKNYILPSIEMIPPTRTSRSEYAHYNTKKRNGNNKPQYNFRPEVLKNRMVFRMNNKSPEKQQKYFTVGKKPNYEKVPLKGVKNSFKSVNKRQFIGSRRKRNVNDLLNKAPKIVEQVIDEEIDMRFPKDQNDNDNNEEKHSSIEEIENVSEEKKKVQVEVPEFDSFEVNPSIKISKNNKDKIEKIENKFNNKKYPFYYNEEVLRSSPLKYIIDPQQIPHKTLGGNEFYESRDKYIQCEEIDPDLSKVVPEKEEPMSNRDHEINLPRLRGLGDKILCYKAKYFDENPLDNPLFYEKKVEPLNIPEELNSFNFITRISHLSINPEENIHRRVSKKPEIIDIRPLESRKNKIIDPNQYKRYQAEQSTAWSNHARKHRNGLKTTTALPLVPYQKLVYENVMDTIKNLTHLYKQHPTILNSRPSKVSSRLKKVKKSSNISQNTNRKKINNHFIYITTQTPDILNDILSTDKGNHRKLKIFPYKTNKVTYRTRKITRPVRGLSNKTIGYFKTVRVNKRQVDLSDLDLGESKTINLSNNTLRKRYKKPQNNTQLDQTSIATKKIAYTIIDRAKNFDNQKSNRYSDFTTDKSTSTARNEPKYTTIRRFDDDIYKIKTFNNSNNSKKINERYDVHEENQDEQISNPIKIKQKEENDDVSKNDSDDIENNSNIKQFSGSTFYDDESSSDDDQPRGYDKQKQSDEQVEQMERPYESDIDSNSDDESNVDESDNSENYHKEKSDFFTISDHEKDFERYSSRPLSPYQSFDDPKYASLGSRINKPAFYHPLFESIDSENHDEKYRDVSISKEAHENKYGISKFTFPWHEDDESISEEIKNYKKIRRNYEFPWERRARLRAIREEIDRRLAEEHYPLESVRKFKKIYPWKSSFNHRSNKFGSNFWMDDDNFNSHVMNSKLYPIKQNHSKERNLKASNEEKEVFVEPRKEEQENSTDRMTTVTTTILQIPATSAKFLADENRSTTPTVLLTTSKEVFKLKPQSRRRGNIQNTGVLTNDQSKLESKIVTSSMPKLLIKKTLRKRKLPDRNNNNRRFRMISTSTTIKPIYKKLSNYSIDGESTKPTKRKIEHRSKVSKEKIITKTIFPSTEPIIERNINNNDNNYERHDGNNNNDNTQINEMIKKLSIITNENPEHIFHTKEIEENGRKNLFITIIPNNHTQNVVIDRINIEDLYKNTSNGQESKERDKSLPLNDKLKLTERDTKKMMESMSWISENYDT